MFCSSVAPWPTCAIIKPDMQVAAAHNDASRRASLSLEAVGSNKVIPLLTSALVYTGHPARQIISLREKRKMERIGCAGKLVVLASGSERTSTETGALTCPLS